MNRTSRTQAVRRAQAGLALGAVAVSAGLGTALVAQSLSGPASASSSATSSSSRSGFAAAPLASGGGSSHATSSGS